MTFALHSHDDLSDEQVHEVTEELLTDWEKRLREVDVESLTHERSRVFEEFFSARGPEKEERRAVLLISSEPLQILKAALTAYDERGNQDRLTEASWLLAEYGTQALPCLKFLADYDIKEAEYFIELLDVLNIEPKQKLDLIKSFLNSSFLDVRLAAIESLEGLSEARSLLEELLKEPNDEVVAKALDVLDSFEE